MSGLSSTVIISICHRWSLLLPTFSVADCVERERRYNDPLDLLHVSDDHLLMVYRFPHQEIVRLCDELHPHLALRMEDQEGPCSPNTHPGPCCIKMGTLIGHVFIILDLMLCADED